MFHGRQAEFLGLFDDGPGIFVGSVVMFGLGRDLIAGEVARHVLDHLLFFVQSEVNTL
jgi:hypothetical protein